MWSQSFQIGVVAVAVERQRGSLAFGFVRPALLEICLQKQGHTLFLSLIVGKPL